ncbi:hypothetical protein DFH08DRAFT_723696, partial [Mycena albidolilacea]
IRINRLTFDIFCEILEQNPLFLSCGQKPQRHIAWQLGAFLIRYGQLGSPVQDTSFKLGIGFGTVILYCWRVIRAVHELKPQYAQWFSEEHQLTASAKCEAKIGFPNCVGSSDGSLFQTYAIFAIVDSDLRFGAWDLGWPGSVTNACVFKSSHFWHHRHQYLKDG